MDLKDYREQIDHVDNELVEQFNQRMDIIRDIVDYKMENNLRVLDSAREKEKLAAVTSRCDDDFNQKAIRELFEQIMCIARRRQYQILQEASGKESTAFTPVDSLLAERMRIVYQGAEGSYSEEAMKQFFWEGIDSFSVPTFREAMAAIEEGSADYAVLPIENSTAGIVSEVYDLLAEFENFIVGEQILRINHCLMAPEGASVSSVREVYSHPQSLMQCERFLSEHASWNQISMRNNAFAARKVAEEGDITKAAIAGAGAARRYGLKVLMSGINQEERNSTRFIIVTNRKIYVRGAKKISLCFELPHERGSLYQAMSNLVYNGLNMTKIESRPIEDRNWEYRFFIDFEGSLSEPAVRNALRGLRDECRTLRILGNY